MDKVQKLLEFIQNMPTRFLLALSIILGLILFLPDDFAVKLAIQAFRNEYRIYIGPIFLLTVGYFITQVLTWLWHLYSKKRHKRDLVNQLHDLTPEEKGYLEQYIKYGKNTIYVYMGDGVAGGLLAKGIIYCSSKLFDILEGIPYNLSPWARQYLTSHPELLDGAVGRPYTNSEKLFRY